MPTKLSNLRGVISNFARSYKYELTIVAGNPSSKLASLLSADVSSKIKLSCVNVTVATKGVQEITVEVGVNTMREPGRKEFSGTITPEFLLQSDYSLYKFFTAWNLLCTSDEGQHETPTDYFAEVLIKTLSPKDEVTMVKTYKNVWCRVSPEIQLSDDQNEIVRHQPELVYELDDTANT
jgi:hypothetical protein